MPSSHCRHFDTCEAPVCPMEEQDFHHIWYPDEAICRRRDYQRLPWIQKQKQIAKKHGSTECFFTVEMLDAVERVNKGIAGADPDVPLEKRADLKWIKDLERQRQNKKQHRILASAKKKIGRTSKLRKD